MSRLECESSEYFALLVFNVSAHFAVFQLYDFLLLGNHGNLFLATAFKYADPVVFHVHGTKKTPLLDNQKPMTSYPELYKGKSTCFFRHRYLCARRFTAVFHDLFSVCLFVCVFVSLASVCHSVSTFSLDLFFL